MDPPTCATHTPKLLWDHWIPLQCSQHTLGCSTEFRAPTGTAWTLELQAPGGASSRTHHFPCWLAAELGRGGRCQYQHRGSKTKENMRFNVRSPSTSDTNTQSFPPSDWLLILMNFSGWDFPWLLNEALAVWPLTLEPRNSMVAEQPRACLSNPTNLTATVHAKNPRVRVVWTSPPTSQASPPAPLAGATNREWGHTWSSAETGSAMQTWLWFRKINHQFQRKNPTEGYWTDTTCGSESTTCKSKKDFRENHNMLVLVAVTC